MLYRTSRAGRPRGPYCALRAPRQRAGLVRTRGSLARPGNKKPGGVSHSPPGFLIVTRAFQSTSERSDNSAAFGFAPMICLTGLPPLNRINVGIDMTW